jgi:hypothetical protein
MNNKALTLRSETLCLSAFVVQVLSFLYKGAKTQEGV